MSRLQHALHAFPPGSVTRAMFADMREVNAHLAARAREEIELAQYLQRRSGCTWSAAIREAADTLMDRSRATGGAGQ